MNRVSLEDHFQSAEDLKEVVRLLRGVRRRVLCFPKAHKLNRLFTGLLDKTIPAIKSEMDNDFHELITHEQHEEFGDIYYGGKVNENID